MVFTSLPLYRTLAVLCVLTGLAACAVQPNARGGYTVGVDTAELFGTEIGKFSVQDGIDGTLRREGKKFSIKLSRFQRVVPLPNIDAARIARVEDIGDWTVVVIETAKGNCNYRYTVLAIKGSDVLSWDMGNCVDRPLAIVLEDRSAMALDFPKGAKIERFIYTQDGRMLHGEDAPAPGLNVRAKPFADASLNLPVGQVATGNGGASSGSASAAPDAASARFVPAPPQRTVLTRSAPNASSSSGSPAVAQRARSTAAAVSAVARPARDEPMQAPTTFKAAREEVTPIRLDLRN